MQDVALWGFACTLGGFLFAFVIGFPVFCFSEDWGDMVAGIGFSVAIGGLCVVMLGVLCDIIRTLLT